LEGQIVRKIGEINYYFYRGKRYFKSVHFYLLKYVGGSMGAHDLEADRVMWFPIPEALRVLTHVNERKILGKADEMVKSDRSLLLSSY
jgi:hypothetical protein